MYSFQLDHLPVYSWVDWFRCWEENFFKVSLKDNNNKFGNSHYVVDCYLNDQDIIDELLEKSSWYYDLYIYFFIYQNNSYCGLIFSDSVKFLMQFLLLTSAEDFSKSSLADTRTPKSKNDSQKIDDRDQRSVKSRLKWRERNDYFFLCCQILWFCNIYYGFLVYNIWYFLILIFNYYFFLYLLILYCLKFHLLVTKCN